MSSELWSFEFETPSSIVGSDHNFGGTRSLHFNFEHAYTCRMFLRYVCESLSSEAMSFPAIQ